VGVAAKAGLVRRGDAALLEAQDDVRRTIARDLHDGPVQTLTAMIVELEILRRAEGRAAEDTATIERLTASARSVMSGLRFMLYDLRSEKDQDPDLLESIRPLVSRFTEMTGIAVEIAAPDEAVALPQHKSLELRRIVGEALNNVARHAHASGVQLTLQVVEETLVVTVTDNGRGMQPLLASPGVGIRGMRERAAVIGARLTFDSTVHPGTRVRLALPLEYCN
jgi:signal transduction histidine kinase